MDTFRPVHEPPASLVYAPYQHTPLKHWAGERSKPVLNPAVETPTLRIYPNGFSMTKERFCDGEQPAHLKDVSRGKIEGFSRKSASRFRQFMLTHHKVDALPYAVTFTTHKVKTPLEWENAVKRFRTALSRKFPDWPMTWRVELQKRKTPHLHCLAWLPKAPPDNWIHLQLITLWLKAFDEYLDVDSWRYAVSMRFLDGPAWLRYCSCHDSKHKEEQLGWKGRQWGVWNRKAFEQVEPLTEGEFTRSQRVHFVRRLRQHSRRRFHRRDGTLAKPLTLYADRNLPAFVLESHVIAQLLRGIVSD